MGLFGNSRQKWKQKYDKLQKKYDLLFIEGKLDKALTTLKQMFELDNYKEDYNNNLFRKYEIMGMKCKTQEALAALDELIERGSDLADYTLVSTYTYGRLYSSPKMKKHIYYKNIKDDNTVDKDTEKVRYYLQKILERYEKKRSPHIQMSAKDNYQIGYLKTQIAYTYYYRTAKKVDVSIRKKVVLPITGKEFWDTVEEKYEYRLGEPEGNEYTKYMEWILRAAAENRDSNASMRLAIANSMEYELFGLERDVDRAAVFAIDALQNYTEEFEAPASFKASFDRFEILDLLKELSKESQKADIVYKGAIRAQEKARLEYELGMMKIAYNRDSFLERELGGITWVDKKTGLEIENIDEELKKMEEQIAEMEKTLASM